MPDDLRIALAQMNAVVGDVDGNAAKIEALATDAREAGAQMVVFPELALTGYPPEDLLLKRSFLRRAQAALEGLVAGGITAIVGWPEAAGGRVYNAAAVVADGQVQAVYRKMLLPNYGVFDERRWFEPGSEPVVVDVAGTPVGITVCEDIWAPEPTAATAAAGAQRRGEPVRLALPPREGNGARADDRRARARQPRHDGLLQPGGRPGRAGLRRAQPDRRAHRRRDGARASVRGGARPAGRGRGAAAARGGGVPRARHRRARLRRQERLREGRDRVVGRDRLRAHGAGGDRRARARARGDRDDAVALLLRGDEVGRAQAVREPRGRAARDPDRAGHGRLRRAARGRVRGPRAPT